MSKDKDTKKAFTHVWRACKEGELDLVRCLIREGQDPNEQTQSLKNTPLHIAAKHGHLLICLQLIENGAATNIANSYGQSAYDLANESSMFIQNQLNSKRGVTTLSNLKVSVKEAQKLLENLEQVKMLIAKIPNSMPYGEEHHEDGSHME